MPTNNYLSTVLAQGEEVLRDGWSFSDNWLQVLLITVTEFLENVMDFFSRQEKGSSKWHIFHKIRNLGRKLNFDDKRLPNVMYNVLCVGKVVPCSLFLKINN